MNNATPEIQKAMLFWLSGVRLEGIRALPEVSDLIQQGAMVELDVSPITGRQSQHYQVLSGREPSSFGFFDTLVPREYTVIEEKTGRGTTPKLLPEIVRTAGWEIDYSEIQPAELVNCIERWTQYNSSSPACLIVKCTIEDASSLSMLSKAMSIANEWMGEMGLLAVLSDIQPAHVKRLVNVNNFLAEVGIIERDEESGKTQWSNSLAYFAGHGQLWINLRGRDAQGIVNPHDEYDQVRETLIKVLPVKLFDPQTGEQVIERVYRKEDIYAADYLFCAPDLVVSFKPGYAPSQRSTRIDFDTTTFSEPDTGMTATQGMHPSQVGGFLLASAPVLTRGIALTEKASLTSVYPTFLHALGLELRDLEIPAISALFDPVYLEAHPIRSIMESQELSDEDEELIISRLRDLGYV